jgi:hypothetical protein
VALRCGRKSKEGCGILVGRTPIRDSRRRSQQGEKPLLQKAPSDHDPLDLIGALVDLGDLTLLSVLST